MSATSTRRPKWYHHPPPPTPKILHFPRRRSSSSAFKVPAASRPYTSSDNNALKLPTLKTLFNREEHACAHPHSQGVPIVVFGRDKSSGRRTERERTKNQSSNVVMVEEENWKFQADMLRAECNLLRMEKEIALKKLERTRSKMESTLRSALHTLLSGRIKVCEGKNIEMVLDHGIHELTEKLQRLHKRSERTKDSQVSSKSNKNFDKQVSVLQRRLEKIGGSSDEIYLREFQEMEKVSLSIKTSGRIDDDTVVARGKLNVEILRRKMEGLSKGKLLQRMEEEYNSMLSNATSSLASSASTSKRIEFQDSSSSTRVLSHQEKVYGEGKLCSGHCKTIVRRIMEQVRAETEQWSQMQEMLGQVREEMEELQASRDFWEDRAQHSDFQIQSLHNSVQEWRDRALSSESKTNELEEKITVLSSDLEMLRKEKNEKNDCVHAVTKCSSSSSSQVPLLETQNELEKRVVVCSSNENTHHIIENRKHDKEIVAGNNRERRGTQDTIGGVLATKRSPFRDIGNLKMRQDGKAVFPFHTHLSSENAEKIN